MVELTSREQAFVDMMASNPELERRGFDMLVERPRLERFFEALIAKGFFEPHRNPGPISAEREGYVRIPYWAPLDYLVAVARLSGQRDDLPLARKVLSLVEQVTLWRDEKGEHRRNHHTSRRFAEILGVLPLSVVTLDAVRLVSVWLDTPFEHGTVAHALDQGVLPRLLSSASGDDWRKALEIIGQCLAIVPPTKDTQQSGMASGVVGDYWVDQLIRHHAKPLGSKLGQDAADFFLGRLRKALANAKHDRFSTIYRPSIEDEGRGYASIVNHPIDGLRDVLLAWCDVDPSGAMRFIDNLLVDDSEVVRRIGIYAIAKRWSHLQELYRLRVSPDLFQFGHERELRELLKEHFSAFAGDLKEATMEALRSLPHPKKGGESSLRLQQLRWLSALAGQGYAPADQWLADLETQLGPISGGRDFEDRFDVRVGPGPSPYSTQDLVTFAQEMTLVERLLDFRPAGTLRGPTVEGLLSALETAVKVMPVPFLRNLHDLEGAPRSYQYAVLTGFQRAWEEGQDSSVAVDWRWAWESVLGFFEHLTESDAFWTEPVQDDGRANRNWVVSSIARLIEVGTRTDERSYPADLLPRTRLILTTLLAKVRGSERPPEDPMFHSLNSLKGKVLDALLNHALRECRVGDAIHGHHTSNWSDLRPLLDHELALTRNDNFEFSTLAGAYLPHLDYMSPTWTTEQTPRIFPMDYPANAACAIAGLAYAPYTRRAYELLLAHNIVEPALRLELRNQAAREKLLERIGAAYLWGIEQLDSPVFSYLFTAHRVDDLATIATVFWSARDGDLTEEQKSRVLDYWERCLTWSRELPADPRPLLSRLATLGSYLKSADARERRLLEAVAPHAHVGHHADALIEDLVRLVDASPEGVAAILGKLIAAHIPDYDFEDRLKTLLHSLADRGQRTAAIAFAEQLRSLPGMQEVYEHLRTPS